MTLRTREAHPHTLFAPPSIPTSPPHHHHLTTHFSHLTSPQPSGVVNEVISINLTTGAVRVVTKGRDFYACPRVSPDGNWIAYVSWDHPHMPWDTTELRVDR